MPNACMVLASAPVAVLRSTPVASAASPAAFMTDSASFADSACPAVAPNCPATFAYAPAISCAVKVVCPPVVRNAAPIFLAASVLIPALAAILPVAASNLPAASIASYPTAATPTAAPSATPPPRLCNCPRNPADLVLALSKCSPARSTPSVTGVKNPRPNMLAAPDRAPDRPPANFLPLRDPVASASCSTFDSPPEVPFVSEDSKPSVLAMMLI